MTNRNIDIYLDNAATTKASRRAIDAMISCMEKSYANASSLHTPGQRAAEVLQEAREKIAACIGASAREIIFTSGGSEADNQALITGAYAGRKKGKMHIVSTEIEHHAILHRLNRLKNEGFDITLIKPDEKGYVSLDAVRAALREDTCLVSVMYANNEIGTIEPIAEIGRLCRERGVIFHTDAVQAVGHIPINVERDNIDMLSFSAHKFHGPKGIGALYVRKGIPTTALIEGGAQERGRRAGTENLPAIVGMAEALCEATENMDEDSRQISLLRDRLIGGLSEIPHSILNGDMQRRLPGNVSFCFEGIEGESLLLLLDDKGIAASSGSACTSGSLDPSHVLLAIGRVHDIAHGSLRLTLSRETTEDEIDYTIFAVKETVDYLRSISPIWRDLITGKREFLIK